MDLFDFFLQQDFGVGQVRYFGRQEFDDLLVFFFFDFDLINVDFFVEVVSLGELGVVFQDEVVDVGQVRGYFFIVYYKRMFIDFYYFCYLLFEGYVSIVYFCI